MPKEGKSKSERFAPTSRFVSVFLPACRDTPFDTGHESFVFAFRIESTTLRFAFER